MKYTLLLLLAVSGSLFAGCHDHERNRSAAVTTTTSEDTRSVRMAPVGATTSSTTVRSY